MCKFFNKTTKNKNQKRLQHERSTEQLMILLLLLFLITFISCYSLLWSRLTALTRDSASCQQTVPGLPASSHDLHHPLLPARCPELPGPGQQTAVPLHRPRAHASLSGPRQVGGRQAPRRVSAHAHQRGQALLSSAWRRIGRRSGGCPDVHVQGGHNSVRKTRC